MAHDRHLVDRILAEAKDCVAAEILALIDRNRETGYGPLYDLVADYPFREGKGLRPAILLAAARAAGGYTDQARTSAAALELYHNVACRSCTWTLFSTELKPNSSVAP
jgi:geranylgeranyl diphosphate synthase type II